jgi:hypothetical protein
MTGVIIPCVALWSAAVVSAADVNVNVGPPSPPAAQSSPAPVIVVPPTAQPAPAPTVVVPPAPATPAILQVEDIEANEVRAQTIYANTIEASNITGAIQQSDKIKMSGKGDIKAPSVTASVIYADKFKAGWVTGDRIFVKNLERK